MLKLRSPMMHGPAVKRLQEKLELIKINVEQDGIYGKDTANAVRKLQWKSGIKEDGVFGPTTNKMLDKQISSLYRSVITPGSELVDISDRHKKPKLFGRMRAWDNIDGVTLHQTGCEMSKDPMGWSRVNAHYGLTHEGVAILINKPEMMMWHAQNLSIKTIGVEIEGNFFGIDGNENTLWRGGGGPHHLNQKMIDGSMVIMQDILRRFKDDFAMWKFIYAHRQSSPTRVCDPGEEIWKQIAKTWVRLAKCVELPNVTFGMGNTLPTQWNENYNGKF